MIDLNKKYRTRDGRPVKIYAVYEQSGYAVHGALLKANGTWEAAVWAEDGKFTVGGAQSYNDLVEIPPYEDFKVDDPVLAWNDENGKVKFKRHFAGVSEHGLPLMWEDGRTSWTKMGTPVEFVFAEKVEVKDQ
jgi:hypothetical protein